MLWESAFGSSTVSGGSGPEGTGDSQVGSSSLNEQRAWHYSPGEAGVLSVTRNQTTSRIYLGVCRDVGLAEVDAVVAVAVESSEVGVEELREARAELLVVDFDADDGVGPLLYPPRLGCEVLFDDLGEALAFWPECNEGGVESLLAACCDVDV